MNSNDNKSRPNPRKTFPGGFFILFLATSLVILTFQNLTNEQAAKVSFSHQAEHLVNLSLVQPEDNRKIALNDNLMTFSGKFKERLSEESQTRFKYLELLNRHHDLNTAYNLVNSSLDRLQNSVKDSADWFLHLSGISIPVEGYWVIGSTYITAERNNAVVIKALTDKPIISLAELQKRFPPSEDQLSSYSQDFKNLIQGFKSSTLGIGNEEMKNKLSEIESSISHASLSDNHTYTKGLTELQAIVNDLNHEYSNVRLSKVRSVRNYLSDLNQFNNLNDELAKNRMQIEKARQAVSDVVWYFNNQELSSRALEKIDDEVFSHWFMQAKNEYEAFNFNKGALFKAPGQPRTLALDRAFKSEEPSPNYLNYLFTLMPVMLLIFLLYFMFSKQMKGVGNNPMNFGKSPAKLLTKERNKVTFKDVAGCDEAKEELQEIVEFLRDPTKFTALGAKIPKGVLCIGAPGTGKTLIAKAVAGEADRPFFFISGSDFVEMFVGVGASRIRDMFTEARKSAPCIIFMDEIDAVGRHRGGGVGGGHDEREQTLNQLLVEMDGFDPSEGIILIAATNRPDVLDRALLRPGRFDRRVVIDLPDLKGRFEILKVHARRIKLDPSVDLMDIARNTPGRSGADLMNVLNEAALLAARRNKTAVTSSEAKEACDKVLYGKERRSLDIDTNEKRTTAYHESGHAIIGLLLKGSDPVDKVTIIPRGMSLGATYFQPKKNRLSYWKKEILDQLAVLMGGRAAEEIFIGDISSGAQMDISQATKLARSMVCEWGMTTLGTIAYDERGESNQYLGGSAAQEKSYSNETAQKIDAEVEKIIKEAHALALKVIKDNQGKVELMTNMLMEFETLDREDINHIINDTWSVEEKRIRLKLADELHKKPSIPHISPAIRDIPIVTDRPDPQQI